MSVSTAPAAPAAPDDLIDERVLAAWLDLAVKTIQSWRERGLGPPFFRLGQRTVRYRRADVAHWLARHRVVAARRPRAARSGGPDGAE